MDDTEISGASWPQTVFHVLAAGLLIIPLVFITGFLAGIFDYMSDFLAGPRYSDGEGIGLVIRGFQYFVAATASLALPHLLLKRSNAVVAASVWCAIVATLFVVTMLLAFISEGSSDWGLWQWLEIAASFAGIVAGPIVYARAVADGLH